MRFVTIDFETANRNRNSPCEVGVTVVEDGALVETKSWLIKPKPFSFDYFNTRVHGITRDTVAHAPEFDAVWRELQPMLEGQFIIAHNAGFDIGVLRSTLDHYGLAHPRFDYSCSYLFAKGVWPHSPSYGLHDLCTAQGISFQHHRAGSDSQATALLCLKAFEVSGIRAPEEISTLLQTGLGQVAPNSFRPSRSKRARPHVDSASNPTPTDSSKHDVDNIFYGSTVVFTGTLGSMTRGEAQQLVADIGGMASNNVTKDTNFLVVGQQDVRLVGNDGMSGKQEKAVSLKAKGHQIEFMSEADFLSHIEGETSLAMKLALKFADTQNIPARYRRGNTSGSVGKADEGVEGRFTEEIKIWDALILSMSGHLGKDVATRYLTSSPNVVTSQYKTLTDCLDFVEFNGYVQRRRDDDMCSSDELGLLALLLTELQKCAARQLNSVGIAEYSKSQGR